jgi:hypothetical protein
MSNLSSRTIITILLTLCACSWTARADEPIPSAEALLQTYKELGLPLAPEQAPLVRIGATDQDRCGLAFLIKG